MKREKTNALPVEDSGCITWNQEFEHVCLLTSDRLGVFQPWHVYLVLCKVHTCLSTQSCFDGWNMITDTILAT
jgi:hypothetical protein